MSVLEITPKTDEQQRREAVFLVPLDLLSLSEDYYQTRKDLLNEDAGVIISQQVDRVIHQGQITERATDSLIFDATERDEGRYVWQLSRGSFGSRTISQVVVTEVGIEGWTFSSDTQGASRKSEKLDDRDSITELWAQIQEQITSNEAAECEALLRSKKLKALILLSEFIASGKMTIDIPSYGEDTKPTERRLVAVAGEKFDSERENLEEAVRRAGFTMLKAFRPKYTDFVVEDPFDILALRSARDNTGHIPDSRVLEFAQ